MFFDRLFRSFVPLQNPIGFGPADFLELALAMFLALLALTSRPWIEPLVRRAASRAAWCMLVLAILPIALRLALLPHHPVPSPDVPDEFAHLLAADTLRHLRLANPTHPLHQFFETVSVLQQPAYGSIYSIGQGMVLALGRAIFGHPWAGVLLSTGALCSLCYWMLRSWTPPVWALVGGALAVIQFGPLNQWTNSYGGGSLAAAAGCMVFGALPRLLETSRPRDAVILGAGLGLHLLTRPYESIFLLLSVSLFLLPAIGKRDIRRKLLRPAWIAIVTALPAVALMAAHNKAMTGSFTMSPEALSRQQYGVPAALTFHASPAPARDLTPQQERNFRMQLSYRPAAGETITSYLLRLEYRVRFYRFFFIAPLVLTLPFFLAALGEYRYAWVLLTLAIFALGANFNPSFDPQDIAAITCLFILIVVTGLQKLSGLRSWAGRDAAWVILALCGAHFVFWYGVHVFDTKDGARNLVAYETWDAINHGNPSRRIAVNQTLASSPGQQLVFVRYAPAHPFQDEWVYNDADFDRARVVWARDLGPDQNEQLLRYYPSRMAWLLEPDIQPPRLTPYDGSQRQNEPPPTQPKKPPQRSPFEEVK